MKRYEVILSEDNSVYVEADNFDICNSQEITFWNDQPKEIKAIFNLANIMGFKEK